MHVSHVNTREGHKGSFPLFAQHNAWFDRKARREREREREKVENSSSASSVSRSIPSWPTQRPTPFLFRSPVQLSPPLGLVQARPNLTLAVWASFRAWRPYWVEGWATERGGHLIGRQDGDLSRVSSLSVFVSRFLSRHLLSLSSRYPCSTPVSEFLNPVSPFFARIYMYIRRTERKMVGLVELCRDAFPAPFWISQLFRGSNVFSPFFLLDVIHMEEGSNFS